MRNNLFIVAKEGWKYLGVTAGFFVLFLVLDLEFLSFLAFLTLIIIAFLFRNPERALPLYQEGSVVSVVDGTVRSIQEIQGSEYAYKVEIESSYMDVSVLRVPFHSTLKEMILFHGTRCAKEEKLFQLLNENVSLVFEDPKGKNIRIIHTLKKSFDGIKIDGFKNQKFIQGSRYGTLLSGVTTIYLPQDFRLNINIGNELKASESLIGYFS